MRPEVFITGEPEKAVATYVGPQIKIVKQSDSAIIPDRKATLMKRMSDMETELGRMMKLLKEMRADALHLMVE